MKIAIEGCCHGELDKIYETLEFIQSQDNIRIDLLIICGDFQAVRNTNDLESMAVPQKFRKLNTFYKYYSGEKTAPILTIFIGGNHEASNYLCELPYGGWVAKNIYYLGYAGVVQIGGLRIGGISGIYKGQDYMRGHHEKPPYNPKTIRSCYHVRNIEAFRLKQISKPLDIMISHDWPQGIYNYGNVVSLLKYKKYFRDEVNNNTLGSICNKELLFHLKPRYWFSAHLHCKFAAVVGHANEKGIVDSTTNFLALDKCLPSRQFLQIIDIQPSNHLHHQNISAISSTSINNNSDDAVKQSASTTPAATTVQLSSPGPSNGDPQPPPTAATTIQLSSPGPSNDDLQPPPSLPPYPSSPSLKLRLDPEWLCILKSTNHLFSLSSAFNYLPRGESDGSSDFRATMPQLAELELDFDGDFSVPDNFEITAPVHGTTTTINNNNNNKNNNNNINNNNNMNLSTTVIIINNNNNNKNNKNINNNNNNDKISINNNNNNNSHSINISNNNNENKISINNNNNNNDNKKSINNNNNNNNDNSRGIINNNDNTSSSHSNEKKTLFNNPQTELLCVMLNLINPAAEFLQHEFKSSYGCVEDNRDSQYKKAVGPDSAAGKKNNGKNNNDGEEDDDSISNDFDDDDDDGNGGGGRGGAGFCEGITKNYDDDFDDDDYDSSSLLGNDVNCSSFVLCNDKSFNPEEIKLDLDDVNEVGEECVNGGRRREEELLSHSGGNRPILSEDKMELFKSGCEDVGGLRVSEVDKRNEGGEESFCELLGKECDELLGNECDKLLGNECDKLLGNKCDKLLGNKCDKLLGKECDKLLGNECDKLLGNKCDELLGNECDVGTTIVESIELSSSIVDNVRSAEIGDRNIRLSLVATATTKSNRNNEQFNKSSTPSSMKLNSNNDEKIITSVTTSSLTSLTTANDINTNKNNSSDCSLPQINQIDLVDLDLDEEEINFLKDNNNDEDGKKNKDEIIIKKIHRSTTVINSVDVSSSSNSAYFKSSSEESESSSSSNLNEPKEKERKEENNRGDFGMERRGEDSATKSDANESNVVEEYSIGGRCRKLITVDSAEKNNRDDFGMGRGRDSRGRDSATKRDANESNVVEEYSIGSRSKKLITDDDEANSAVIDIEEMSSSSMNKNKKEDNSSMKKGLLEKGSSAVICSVSNSNSSNSSNRRSLKRRNVAIYSLLNSIDNDDDDIPI